MLSDTDMLNNIRKGTRRGCHGIANKLPETEQRNIVRMQQYL